MSWLNQLAARAYRAPAAATVRERRLERIGTAMLLAAVIVPLLLATGLIGRDLIQSWSKAMAPLPIDRSTWHVSFGEDPAQLWDSALRRSDAEHRERLLSRTHQTFWLGTELSAELLQQAAVLRANHLIVGYFSASYQVWIDGALYTEGRRSDQRFPIVIALPMARLGESRPLKVALQLVHDAGSFRPDALATNRIEGLTTGAGAEAYMVAETIENQTRPALFFGLYLTLGIWALTIWAINSRRQEFLYMGAYALFHCLLQPVNSNLSGGFLSIPMARHLFMALIIYEGIVALNLGCGLARVRRAYFVYGMPFMLAAPWVVVFFFGDSTRASDISRAIHQWFVPACYFVAAGICCVQAAFLKNATDCKLQGRARRLMTYAAGLFVLGSGYVLQASSFLAVTDYAVGYRLGNFVIVAIFTGLAMKDFRSLDRIADVAPVSKYHRREPLPVTITGVMLSLDIKNSEFILRHDGVNGESGRSLFVCLSHMWSVISQHGGTVLQTDGDSLIAFFEHQPGPSVLKVAVMATNDINAGLMRLSRQFKDTGILPETYGIIQYRAALVEGDIKPVWQEVNGERFASWTGSGASNVFLEAARLMELERQVSGRTVQSAVVVRSNLIKKLDLATNDSQDWLSRDTVLADKHQTDYRVGVYLPNVAPEKLVA